MRSVADRTPVDWAVRPLRRYAQFSGRAPRAEYWWFYLGTLIIDRLLSFLDKQLAGGMEPLSGLFALAILLPWIAVTVRRLHDTGRSGWWLLVLVVPALAFLGFVMEIAFIGGEPFEQKRVIVSMVLTVLAAIGLFVLMVLPGTSGANRHGADPYRPDEQLEEIFA